MMNKVLNKNLFGKDSYTDYSADDILSAFGLQRESSTASYVLPALGLFGIGVIVGAGLGMLFAPKAGSDLRHTIADKANSLGRKVGITGGGMGYEGGYEAGGRFEGRGYESTGSTYEGAGIGTSGGIGSSGVIGSKYEGKGPYPTSSTPGVGGE
jgi:hypothetical protein